MLPPLGPLALGHSSGQPSGQPAVTSATEGPSAKPFADNMLAYRQVTPGETSPSGELDHNLDQNLDQQSDQNLNQNFNQNFNQNLDNGKPDSGQPNPGLDSAPVDIESMAAEALHVGVPIAIALEDYDLTLANPLRSNGLIMPDALPPSGRVLPLAALASIPAVVDADADVDPNFNAPTAQDGLPRLDNALTNIWESVVANGMSSLPIARFNGVVGTMSAGEIPAGFSALGPEAARVPIQGSLLNNEMLNPSNPGAAALLRTATAASEAAVALTGQPTTPAALPSQGSAATIDPLGSLLASKDGVLASLRGGSELPAMPTAGTPPSQLSARVDPGLTNVPVAGTLQARPGVETTPGALANAVTVGSDPAATPKMNAEASGVSSQLAMSAAASALTDRASPAARSIANLLGPNGRGEGQSVAAGNRIAPPAESVTAATVSTQRRTELANVDQRQLPTSFDNSLLAMSGNVSSPTEGGDAANLSTSSTTAQMNLQRTAIGMPALASGLMSAPANGRLDVSDGSGGQWVGRLSQMIAQQQLTGQSLRIALSPAELGALELTFSGAADNWSVSLSAQQGQTRELLESHLDRIRAMLQDLGHGDAQVSLSDRWNGGETGSGQQPASGSQTSDERNGGWQHSAAVLRPAGDSTLQANLAKGNEASDTPSGVDAYV